MSNKIKRDKKYQARVYKYILDDLPGADLALRSSLQRFDQCRKILLDIKGNSEAFEMLTKTQQEDLMEILALHGVKFTDKDDGWKKN